MKNAFFNKPGKTSNQKRNFFLGLILTLIFFIIASILQYKHTTFPNKEIDTKSFQILLNQKVKEADRQLLRLMSKVILDKKSFKPNKSKDISYYVYKNDTLIYWSENEIGIPQQYLNYNNRTRFVSFQHSDCVYRTTQNNNLKFVALIHLRNSYNDPNDFLLNEYKKEFNMDSRIKITFGDESDKNAIFTPEGEYLFSLTKGNSLISDKKLSLWSMCFWVIGLLLAYYLSKKLYIFFSIKNAKAMLQIASFFFWIILLFIGIKWNEPWMLFQQDFFSPIYFSSNFFLASMGHLCILTIFFLSETVLFYRILKKSDLKLKKQNLWLAITNICSAITFLLLINISSQLINNSSFNIELYKLENISLISVIAIIVVFCWFIIFSIIRLIGLSTINLENTSLKKGFIANTLISLTAGLTCLIFNKELAVYFIWYWLISTWIDYLLYKQKDIFNLANLGLLIALFSIFEVHLSANEYNTKSLAKILTIAENINSGEIIDRNFLAEILFEELNEELFDDETLLEIANKKDNVENEIQNYLTKNYFRGFWNSYNIKTYLFDQEHPEKEDFQKLAQYNTILSKTDRVKRTNFYFCTDEESKIDYIGVFDLHNEILFIEFYSKLRNSSYSYPEPLLQANKRNSYSSELSIARYRNGFISAQVGDYKYPVIINWYVKKKEQFYSFDKKDYRHYVYKPSTNTTIIISKPIGNLYYSYIVYAIYLFTMYFAISSILRIVIRIFKRESIFNHSYLSRLQFTFIALFIISFIGVFSISTSYIIHQYEKKQETDLLKKKVYISTYISDIFKDAENLRTTNVIDLNFKLQELSKTFETDIHIYDPKGYLITSSQPIIFAKGLISYRISPAPFFEGKSNVTLTENIGELNYLSSYTPIYNKDFKLLGYIAVPSFLSSDEMQKEIFSLLSVIINVYLLIIFIAILASFIVNRNLSQPIKQLEEKLKSISLKGKNNKLVYKHNDEIGHLVEQYNLMIDELENSAEKLAQSERETAWKQMARQVTHEINNPLTPMKLTIQQLQRMKQTGHEDFEEYFNKSSKMLIEQIEHLSSIASSFSDFAKMPESDPTRINIVERLEGIITLFRNNYEKVGIIFSSISKEIFIKADKEEITQIFNNLIKNAIQAIPSEKKGVIFVNISTADGHTTIEIKDNGSGITTEIQDKLFEPNFTTKNSGMGLGLAIVRNIIEKNSGKIWFETETNRGTSFYVRFPII